MSSSFERFRNTPHLPELQAIAARAQAVLALQLLHDQKPELPIDVTSPENTTHEIRAEAMRRWIEEYAESFRNYVEHPEHAHEQIDLSSESEREQLLKAIQMLH